LGIHSKGEQKKDEKGECFHEIKSNKTSMVEDL